MGRPKKVDPKVVIPKIYRCTCCGREFNTPARHFFKAPHSKLWDDNDRYSTVCIDCLNSMFDYYKTRYNEQKALVIICHYLDIPFYFYLYDSIVQKNDKFSLGLYTRIINGKQYEGRTFVDTLMDKRELEINQSEFELEKETKWSKEEIQNRNDAIAIIGYDPFEGYPESDRRFLFNDLIKYFDDDIADDTFKLSMIIQIVNNNYQIWRINVLLSTLDPVSNADDIQKLNKQKTDLVASNDKIAKENEISVKNRSNKDVGKSTLTYLMKDLRKKNFKEAEENFYNQLVSAGSQWAIDMSNKSIKENAMFDENDKEEILQIQRDLVQEKQRALDELEEKYRLLQVEVDELRKRRKR